MKLRWNYSPGVGEKKKHTKPDQYVPLFELCEECLSLLQGTKLKCHVRVKYSWTLLITDQSSVQQTDNRANQLERRKTHWGIITRSCSLIARSDLWCHPDMCGLVPSVVSHSCFVDSFHAFNFHLSPSVESPSLLELIFLLLVSSVLLEIKPNAHILICYEYLSYKRTNARIPLLLNQDGLVFILFT